MLFNRQQLVESHLVYFRPCFALSEMLFIHCRNWSPRIAKSGPGALKIDNDRRDLGLICLKIIIFIHCPISSHIEVKSGQGTPPEWIMVQAFSSLYVSPSTLSDTAQVPGLVSKNSEQMITPPDTIELESNLTLPSGFCQKADHNVLCDSMQLEKVFIAQSTLLLNYLANLTRMST